MLNAINWARAQTQQIHGHAGIQTKIHFFHLILLFAVAFPHIQWTAGSDENAFIMHRLNPFIAISHTS